MHEFSLAKAVKNTILGTYKDNKDITVLIGEIQQIDVELFKDALLKELGSLDISLKFELLPAKLKCNICSFEFYYNELNLSEEEKESIHFIPETIHIFVKCPNCNSNDFKIIEGRGIYVKV